MATEGESSRKSRTDCSGKIRTHLIFVHRDADAVDGYERRLTEITAAAANVRLPKDTAVIPVIPVTMTELWILHALTNKQFSQEMKYDGLALPKVKEVPSISDAKATFSQLCQQRAASFSRRKRKRAQADQWKSERQRILGALTDVALLDGCESFDALRDHVARAIGAGSSPTPPS